MKRANSVLNTPASVSDVVFEDYFQEDDINPKAERSAVKAHRKLKQQLS